MTALAVLAIGWFVLAVVNLVRGVIVVALAYALCGVIITTLTLRLSRGRRTR